MFEFFPSLIITLILPFLYGGIVVRGLFSVCMQWIIGLFLLAVTLIVFHGLGLSKNLVFWFIYLISISSLIFYAKTVFFLPKNKLNFFGSFDFIDALFYLIIFVLLIDAFLSIDRHPLTAGDAVAYWYQKAKALYHWLPIESFPTLAYPNMGSAIWMFGMNYAEGSENVGRSIFPLLLMSIYVSYWLLMKQYFDIQRKNKLIISLLFSYLAYISITKQFGGGYTYVNAGYIDWLVGIIPCFSYMLLFFNTELFRTSGEDFPVKKYFLIIFLLGSTALIKSEGFILVFIFIFSYFFIQFFRNKRLLLDNKKNHVYGLIFLIFIATLYRQILFINGIDYENAQGFNLGTIVSSYTNIIDRTPIIMKQMIYHFRHHFDIILPFLILLCFMLKHKKYFLISIFLIPLTLHFMSVLLVFYSTTLPLEWHLATALDRLMHQTSYMYIFGIILYAFILADRPRGESK